MIATNICFKLILQPSWTSEKSIYVWNWFSNQLGIQSNKWICRFLILRSTLHSYEYGSHLEFCIHLQFIVKIHIRQNDYNQAENNYMWWILYSTLIDMKITFNIKINQINMAAILNFCISLSTKIYEIVRFSCNFSLNSQKTFTAM